MGKIITYDFSQDFISSIADHLQKDFSASKNDLSRIAIVFGGKRPSLFLKKELAARFNSAFFPPQCFSMDEFIKFILSKEEKVQLASDLESAYLIYKTASYKAPDVLWRREAFADFLPWAKEIRSFIDELDLEEVASDKLDAVELSAKIGYEIPESINKLLANINSIVAEYHSNLKSRGLLSRGLLYKEAGSAVSRVNLGEFDRILFCNFYYLHKSEERLIKYLFDTDKADLFFQKDAKIWPVLTNLAKTFGSDIQPLKAEGRLPKIHIYKGFDTHSQVGLVRTILKDEITHEPATLNKTLVILPEPDNLVPILSEIAGEIPEFNVSMGYPLKRSSLFNLLQFIFKAQGRLKGNAYYTRDYLRVLAHPLIKNLLTENDPALNRVMVHKIEEMLLGMHKTPLSGSLFSKLKDIEACDDLYNSTMDTLIAMDIQTDHAALKEALYEIHKLSFYIWEEVASFSTLALALEEFANGLLKRSFVSAHPLNLKVLENILDVVEELKGSEFKDLPFPKDEIFKILESKLKDEKVSFKGSPLKGLQLLGLLETRSLTFENVIIMDANEGLLPNVSAYEPLVPPQIMEVLGLKRLRQEEEIQRYHFMRLLLGAKRAYFVYNDSPEKERSRFLEELIWQKQKNEESLIAAPDSVSASFNISVLAKEKVPARKSPEMVLLLKNDYEYSASSVDTYLACPLKFYYQNILRLRQKEDLLDEPQGKDIGNFLHGLLDYAYRQFLGRDFVLDKKFEEFFFEDFRNRFSEDIRKRMGPEAFMVEEIMHYRLKKFLEFERQRKIKQIISLESGQPAGKIKLCSRDFQFKYRIDRIDLLENGSLLVLDYKSGSAARGPESLERLAGMELNRQDIKKNLHSFQLPIYYYFTAREFQGKPLNAALYSLRDISLSYFVKENNLESADKLMDLCLNALEVILAEIIDPAVDFYPDDSDERACQYCPFSALCQ